MPWFQFLWERVLARLCRQVGERLSYVGEFELTRSCGTQVIVSEFTCRTAECGSECKINVDVLLDKRERESDHQGINGDDIQTIWTLTVKSTNFILCYLLNWGIPRLLMYNSMPRTKEASVVIPVSSTLRQHMLQWQIGSFKIVSFVLSSEGALEGNVSQF